MKIKRITSEENFNPSATISSSEIFSRKTETIDDEGTTIEVRSFADDSLFSRKVFGVMNTEEEYSCDCGKFIGKFYEGVICDKCGTEVKKVVANIDRTGWIDLENNHLLKYIPYMMLEKVIGRENLKNIIHTPNMITIAGNLDLDAIQEIQDAAPNQKYWHIGINAFYERYNEILDYYFYLNHKKEEDLAPIKDEEGNQVTDESGNPLFHEPKKNQETRKMRNFLCSRYDVFTNKIPVLSAVLRPAMRTEAGLKLDSINILYVNILKNVEILRDKVNNLAIIQEITLEALQAQYFQLSEEALEVIKGKNGLIRNQICGTRINFSARNIISPAKKGYKMDEIVLPYITFLELYKYEITNVLCQIKGISLLQANKMVFDAKIEFNEEIYLIMKKIIQEEEIGVLLNRNPTISLGSILYLRVTGIKHNNYDNTMSISNLILTLLSGSKIMSLLNE